MARCRPLVTILTPARTAIFRLASFAGILMADIFPFRGWRYDTGKVRLEDILTQPYDKITPAMQERYYAASPFNLISIEKGKSFPEDTSGNNAYTRASARLDEWIQKGILMQDATPSIYAYSQEFAVPGAAGRITRRGFISLARLEDYSAGVVFPHEKTLSAPKADRLELLRNTHVQTGQLFMMYEDRSGDIETLLDSVMAATPAGGLLDEFGVRHQLWVVSGDHAMIEDFRHAMAPKKIVIADGHHRYETALAYRDERRHRAFASDPDAPYEKAMMTFVNYAVPGLVILPTHRVIRNLKNFDPAAFRRKVSRYFEEIPKSQDLPPSAESGNDRLRRELQHHVNDHAIGVCTAEGCALYRLRPEVSLLSALPDLSPAQRNLDVVLLHRLVLQDCLGISSEATVRESNIVYEREMDAAIAATKRADAQIAFLLNPVSVEQVAEMALAGDVLPQKSTDFYPKLLSGLAIYGLDR